MKVLLALHGYPPELVGGTEKACQSLARGLAADGVEVVVVAGSMQHEEGFRTSEATDQVPGGPPIRIRRIHRADLFFDHWQKSASARVAQEFQRILAEERPDLVHVHQWIRLSRDLVHRAALERIPSVVTLHDLWTSCLVTFRVRPDTGAFCEAPLGPSPCLDCAAMIPPRTPWVPRESLFLEVARHRGDLVRELELARAVLVPSAAHGRAVARFLGLGEGFATRVVPDGRELRLAPRTPPPPPGEGEPLVLGAWGHVHPLKGQDRILAAMRRSRHTDRLRLHIAGGEPYAPYAEKVHAAAEGLDVHFHGPYDAEALDAHPVSDVHAMVSGTRAHESYGLVLDEACALGVPMILPNTGAYAERFEEGRGALFYDASEGEGEQAGIDALARLLDSLLEQSGRLGTVRARLPAVGEVVTSVARHVALTREIYEEVIERGAPPEEEVPGLDWWTDRMQMENERAWDESLGRTPPEELGFV